MQILVPDPRLTESESPGVAPSSLCFNKPLDDFDTCLHLRTAAIDICVISAHNVAGTVLSAGHALSLGVIAFSEAFHGVT